MNRGRVSDELELLDRLLSAVVVTLSVYAVWWPTTGDGGRQRDNMKRAEEQLQAVQAIFDAEPRFKEVRTGVYTGQDGAVLLFGDVETTADLFRLMRAVADLRLPVAISWQVRVLAEMVGR